MRTYQKVGIGAAIVIVIAVLIISMVAPYAEDDSRPDTSFTYSDAIHTEETGEVELLLAEASEYENMIVTEDEELGNSYVFDGEGSVSWGFSSGAGLYHIEALYLPLEGNGQDIEFMIYLDGECLTEEKSASLCRLWTDSGEFTKTSEGDETRPSQSECFLWTENDFKLNGEEDLILELTEGEHTIEIVNTRENCMMESVTLYQLDTEDYDSYLETVGAENQTEIEAISSDYIQTIEAETPVLRSSSEIYATYDRSSPYTSPYNATEIRYNTIGGTNWYTDGQWIEWQFEIEESGYYQIGLRYRQNENKGVSSARTITIDGELLFSELEALEFDYNTQWQVTYLGGEEPYQIYLEAGIHTIRFEVDLENIRDLIEEMGDTVYQLNSIYRDIIMVTGTEPDAYRDYNLEETIPDLIDNLSAVNEQLTAYIDAIEAQYGEGCYAVSVMSQLQRQIDSFISKPYTIQKRISMFQTNISSMAEWILNFSEQPLELDCLYITGVGAQLPDAETSIFGKIGHEVRSFIGSFFHSYSSVGTDGDVGEDEVTIEVWIGKGRDQANVLKRLIDEYFTPETGIHVNISIIDGALVKAAIAGVGPDVNLFTTRGEAMNLAFRGAVLDLSQMDSFESVTEDYSDTAFVPYTYQDGIYAIPEEQNFYMMFVRTDILEELNLEIPETWDELMAMLPVLQNANLQIGLPYVNGATVMNSGIGTMNLFPTLLAQMGLSIYSDDLQSVQLINSDAYEAFQTWVDFYKMYDFDLYKDDFNRFRTGEMPIVISNYSLYYNLSAAAPEIDGQWTMVTIPGTEDEDGNINIATSASGTCSIILQDTEYPEEAYEFVTWWNSAEIQAAYAKEIETELGVLGRYTSANLEAFAQSSWYDDEKEELLKQWKAVVEIPEIPGGYYTSRNIDNAFRDVYFNGQSERESLYYWAEEINEELERKYEEIEKRNSRGGDE